MIEIDGSYGNGGGAVIRVASALSAVTGKDIHISNIRKGRPKPGLKNQHLEGLKAIAKLCNGKLEGAEINSEEIKFYPGKIEPKNLDIDISTAGSVGLIFQSLCLPACKAGKPIIIKINGGATFGKWAPPLIATKNILLPILEKIGYKAEINIDKHGFYPAGAAKTIIKIYSCKEFKPLVLDKLDKIMHVGGISVANKFLDKARVAERQARSAEQFLRSKGFYPKIKTLYVTASSPGSGIVLWASDGKTVLGGDIVGERWKKADDVGKGAAIQLFGSMNSRSTVDERISDQILIFMALAKGESKIVTPRLTEHAKTNIWVINKFLDTEFKIDERDSNVLIECTGLKK